ncbi:hypothetical protein EI77_02103 [Prosthecobacter fusiformis]|uniref:AsmA-like protein n=1 Tax=Prosthecobacter fusiformis TaxID=48464 RepID=A0A4R7S1B6_9BACT|nr:hypothetical protein [Prosthecobacter fusiformis]TDU70985.1 hypothetical protein EI77_02103 [Prosthecobacter fusiformis]
MSTRTRLRSGKRPRWLYALGSLLVVCIVILLVMPMLVMGWVRSYLQEEAFRGRMEQLFGTQMRGEVTLAPLHWTGDEVTSAQASVTTTQGWQANLDGLHLMLDWNAFRQGKWRTVGAGIDSITLEKKVVSPIAKPVVFVASAPPLGSTGSSIPIWLRRYLPTETEVDGVSVERFSLLHPGPWNVRNTKVRAATWRQGETSIQVTAEDGIVETPIMLPAQLQPVKLNLTRASVRLSREELQLKEASLKWLDAGEITARGHLRPQEGTWEVSTHIAGIPLQECLTEDWRIRLSGFIEGDLTARGSRTATPVITGQVDIRQGILTALPVLDQLASYTGVERFKRLVLDVATSQVSITGRTRQFEKVILQSNGLLYLNGNLKVEGDQIDGNFMLGVTPETLKWIPGAGQHVFTATHPTGPVGMMWTPLRITGTLQAPREDLSTRLAAAVGKVLLDAPGQVVNKGSELLIAPVLGKDAAALPNEAIKGATDTTGKAVDTGVKLLEGISSGLLGQ